MARSHKERHQYKRKERKRTRQSDPKKIKLHRERFLAAMRQRERMALAPDLPGHYRALVLHAHLCFDPEDHESSIMIGERKIEVPFLVENSEDCHYAISEIKNDFDSRKEKEVLDEHVNKAKFNNFSCRLEVVVDDVRFCSSIISCKYRRWDAQQGQALCALPRR